MPHHVLGPNLSTPLLSVLVCVALSATAAPAQAELQLGADLDYALPIDSRADSGGGFAVRVGYQLRVPFVALTSEVAFNYENFSGSYGPTVYRGLGGVRLGLGEVFRIGPFVHLGVGHLSASGAAAALQRTGFTYDLGLFLDLTLLPIVNLGAHAAYNKVPDRDGESLQWMTFGGHVEFILF